LLADAGFWDANSYFQRCTDLNREILVEELDIGENDVFAVPVLFLGPKSDRTAAFYPDIVNHLVIGMTSIVPKPSGPASPIVTSALSTTGTVTMASSAKCTAGRTPVAHPSLKLIGGNTGRTAASTCRVRPPPGLPDRRV